MWFAIRKPVGQIRNMKYPIKSLKTMYVVAQFIARRRITTAK
jgi:hypothetical protein